MVTVDVERKLQNRVLKWLTDGLGYIYLGNLEDQDNTPVKENLLEKNLKKRGCYSDQLIKRAIDILVDDTKTLNRSLYEINKDAYDHIRYGGDVWDDSTGENKTVQYIDWENIDNNDFYVAEEVSVLRPDGVKHKRPDLILYINGIALGMFELKRSSVPVETGIRQLITNQKEGNILNFFSTAQFLFAGNEAKGLYYGTINTPEKYYLQWKENKDAKDDLSRKIKDLQGDTSNRLRKGIISLCHKERFFSLIRDFVIFDKGIKKLARHNQYFANIAARQSILGGKGGIIWNTQGSGKSLIMVWLARWIIQELDDSRVVVITDREELDDQIESVFKNTGRTVKRARSCADLRNLLNGYTDPVICSLIHKYGHNAGDQSDIDKYTEELLKDVGSDFKAKRNIVAFIDECHRTNSGKLHAAVKALMPKAILIGFTGTPLLKKDKPTSLMTFGPYIHTYKYDEGVEDGVILDLRYEARDVDQDLSSEDKVNKWFETKTAGLTENAKTQLKQRWSTVKKLYSSRQRLEKIAADIIFDMEMKARLADGKGTAMLVAGSIYEACRYWRIFNDENNGFKKCAIVTSYEPTDQSDRTATFDLNRKSEEEYKKETYLKMLGDKRIEDFEADAKKQFRENPSEMKLLIVVDKLLTGFDAPSATYLYIDKSMRDHDLFQAICRVNRPDGDDKNYGYIVDYKDLFRNLESAVKDYTSAAFDKFDEEDIKGLIKNQYDEAENELKKSLVALKELCKGVPAPQEDTDYIDYFCGDDDDTDEDGKKALLRETLYALTASAARAFANCCDRLVSHYGYSEKALEDTRKDISGYNRIKDMIKQASSDYIELGGYEADMRHVLDTYISASDSRTISRLEDMSIVEVLLKNRPKTAGDLVYIAGNGGNAKAAVIDNNMEFEIVRRMATNPKHYGKLSEWLKAVILKRKQEVIDYAEYLEEIVKIAKDLLNPEDSKDYPEGIKGSAARCAIYDCLEGNKELTLDIHDAILLNKEQGWKGSNIQKKRRVMAGIYDVLSKKYKYDKVEADKKMEEIFNLALMQEEYN